MSKICTLWVVTAVCFLHGGYLFGQTSSAVQVYQQEQKALAQSYRALQAQGATLQQIEAWQKQNAPRLAAQRQRIIALEAASPARPAAYIKEVEIPANASKEMADYLTTRADLHNRYMEFRNQQKGASGDPKAVAAALQAFQKQNAAAFQAQAQREKVIAAQSAAQPARPTPPLSLPAKASPQMKAFLTLHNQITREHRALVKQDLAASPAQQAADLQQWQQQNAGRLRQLAQLAQNLSQTKTN